MDSNKTHPLLHPPPRSLPGSYLHLERGVDHSGLLYSLPIKQNFKHMQQHINHNLYRLKTMCVSLCNQTSNH